MHNISGYSLQAPLMATYILGGLLFVSLILGGRVYIMRAKNDELAKRLDERRQRRDQ